MDEKIKVSDSTQHEISCKNCGSKLTFLPGTTSLKCGNCGTENAIEIDESKRRDATKEIDYLSFIRNMASEATTVEVTTVKCTSCGADTTFNPNVVSSECDFCGSPLVAANAHKSRVVEAKAMLPFKVTDNEGVDLYKKWLKKLWFAPNKLKTYARQAEKLAGVYIPYWTYDSDTKTHYTGERGDDYQRTESYTENGETKTRTVTETSWTRVSGRVARFFDDVLIPASQSLPIKYVERLEPWDLENLIPYDTKFLSGFKSETYQVAIEAGFDKAKVKMDDNIRSDIRSDIGGDHQRIHTVTTDFNAITFKHILLPIWISAYRYNQKVYRFMINGRTGEVQGERPWSWIKITLAILAVLAIIGGIYYLSEGQPAQGAPDENFPVYEEDVTDTIYNFVWLPIVFQTRKIKDFFRRK